VLSTLLIRCRIALHLLCSGALLAAASSVAGEPADGDVFGNWTVRCETSEEQASSQLCFIFQNLVLREGGQRVMHIAAGFLPERPEPVALLTLPLGISLPPGGRIQVGPGDPIRFVVERCEPDGCRAGVILRDELFARFRDHNTAEVTIFDGGRNPLTVTVSLSGFAEGMQALRQTAAPAPPEDQNAPPDQL
jgi:invasion protein IalB